jgi:phosphoribosylanthranilate isomerase
MFRIKICGITTVEDATAAAEAGADAVGLNFYAQSPRCIDLATARAIVQSVPQGMAKVGVFVNESLQRMIQVADQLALDFVQLHGDEPPDRLAGLAPRQTIRAFRMSGDDEPLLTYLRACHELGYPPTAVLIDAYKLGIYGGTGKTADWGRVREFLQRAGNVPVVLSGGLSPENVAEAIERARPAAVDVASGVEVAPGRKDAARMGRFVDAARRAWQTLSPA